MPIICKCKCKWAILAYFVAIVNTKVKGIPSFYIRLSQISEQVDTKVITHSEVLCKFLINLIVLVDYLK